MEKLNYVTVRIDPELHHALRVKCAQERVTAQAIIARLIQWWVEVAEEPSGRELPRVLKHERVAAE